MKIPAVVDWSVAFWFCVFETGSHLVTLTGLQLYIDHAGFKLTKDSIASVSPVPIKGLHRYT